MGNKKTPITKTEKKTDELMKNINHIMKDVGRSLEEKVEKRKIDEVNYQKLNPKK